MTDTEYFCWIPEWQEEEEGKIVKSWRIEYAASDYCDQVYAKNAGSWPGGDVTVMVREPGALTEVSVSLQWEPSFHGTVVKHGPRKLYKWETE